MYGVPAGTKKLVLVIRHGEAQHNVKVSKKKGMAPFDAQLGPALTPLGNQQAEAAAKKVADALEAAGPAFGIDDGEQPVFLSSNLLRAVETACRVAPPGGEVLVQPLLRERIAGDYDQPTELETLRRWAADGGSPDVRVRLDAYEAAVADAGGGHAAYIESCWACDCVRTPDGKGWTNRENKQNLKARACEMTSWLEAQPSRVFVLVGHSVFLPRMTGDSGYLQNGEVRSYHLSGGTWTRAPAPAAAAPSVGAANGSIRPPNGAIRPAWDAGVRPGNGGWEGAIRPVSGAIRPAWGTGMRPARAQDNGTWPETGSVRPSRDGSLRHGPSGLRPTWGMDIRPVSGSSIRPVAGPEAEPAAAGALKRPLEDSEGDGSWQRWRAVQPRPSLWTAWRSAQQAAANEDPQQPAAAAPAADAAVAAWAPNGHGEGAAEGGGEWQT